MHVRAHVRQREQVAAQQRLLAAERAAFALRQSAAGDVVSEVGRARAVTASIADVEARKSSGTSVWLTACGMWRRWWTSWCGRWRRTRRACSRGCQGWRGGSTRRGSRWRRMCGRGSGGGSGEMRSGQQRGAAKRRERARARAEGAASGRGAGGWGGWGGRGGRGGRGSGFLAALSVALCLFSGLGAVNSGEGAPAGAPFTAPGARGDTVSTGFYGQCLRSCCNQKA